MIDTDSVDSATVQAASTVVYVLPIERNPVSFKSLISTWFVILFFNSKKMGLDDSVTVWRSLIFMAIILALSPVIQYMAILAKVAIKFGIVETLLNTSHNILLIIISTQWSKVVIAVLLNLLIWLEMPVLIKAGEIASFGMFSNFFSRVSGISNLIIIKCFCYSDAIVLLANLFQDFSMIIVPAHQFIVTCIILYHRIGNKWHTFCYAILLSSLSGFVNRMLEYFHFYE